MKAPNHKFHPLKVAARKAGAQCGLCPLLKEEPVGATPVIAGRSLKLIIVGEAPGRSEIKMKKPFCLAEDTPILMHDLTWKPLSEVVVGDKILTIEEEGKQGLGVSGFIARHWGIATVTATRRTVAEAFKLTMESGRMLIGTPDHRVLTSYRMGKTGFKAARRWYRIDQLVLGKKTGYRRCSSLTSIGAPWKQETSFEAGWLSGFLDGEGHVSGSKLFHGPAKTKKPKPAGVVGFSQNAGPVHERACKAVRDLGFELRSREKSVTNGVVCMRENIAGGKQMSLRFLGLLRPTRLLKDFQNVIGNVSSRAFDADPVVGRESVGSIPVIDIETTMGTFIANGYVVHNCGLSGKMVDRLLTANKLLRSETHLTNAAWCRSDKDKENDRAAVCCAPRLLKELSELPPTVPIVTLGATSAKSVLGMKKILMIRGFIWRVPNIEPKELEAARRAPLKFPANSAHRKEVELKSAILLGRAALSKRVVLPSIHPAFVLRSELWHPIIRLDFKRIGRFVRGEINMKKLADMGKDVPTTNTTLLRRLGSVVSLDIETAPIADWASPSAKRAAALAVENDRMPSALVHKLLCVGLSDRITSICLWPWKKRMAKPLSKFLRTRKLVVGHNMLAYDAIVLRQHGVF